MESLRDYLFKVRAFEDNPQKEETLAAEFGVSRSPVRDVLKELEIQGIIERRKKKGIFLKIPAIDEISQIYDVRAVLEGFAARLAAENASGSTVRELKKHASAYERASKQEKWDKAEEADLAFHNCILETAGNSILTQMMSHFRLLEKSFKAGSPQSDHPQARSPRYSHQRVAEAIVNADLDECEKTMRAHVQCGKELVLERMLGIKVNRFG